MASMMFTYWKRGAIGTAILLLLIYISTTYGRGYFIDMLDTSFKGFVSIPGVITLAAIPLVFGFLIGLVHDKVR